MLPAILSVYAVHMSSRPPVTSTAAAAFRVRQHIAAWGTAPHAPRRLGLPGAAALLAACSTRMAGSDFLWSRAKIKWRLLIHYKNTRSKIGNWA